MDARHKHQRKFIAAKKAAGLERLILWVRPEDKESLKAPGHKPQPAQIVWLALRSSSRRLAPARRSSPMAGNRAVAGRVGTIRHRAPGVAALIAPLGASGTCRVACRCLWRSTGRQRRAPAPFFFMAPFGAVSIRAGRGATEWKSGTAGATGALKTTQKIQKKRAAPSCSSCSS